MPPFPPRKTSGKATGPRRLDGNVLDVAGVTSLLGMSQKMVRARTSRGLLPHRKWGGRIVFLRMEIEHFFETLPGITAAEAIQNVKDRES